MKYLGYIKLDLLQEKEEYKELFAPLSESELADLRESIREGGIVDPLLVDKDGENFYVILAGHHRRMIARELGMEAAPCQLAETVAEIVAALFNNTARRQMTEDQRQEANRKQNRVEDELYQEKLIPEIWERYKAGNVDREFVDNFVGKSPEAQEKMLAELCVERVVVSQDVLERLEERAKEIDEMRIAYETQLGELQTKLATAETERDGAAAELKLQKKKVDEIQERADGVLAEYDVKKEEVTKKMREDLEDEIANAKKEREERIAAVKGKDKEIAALEDQITFLKSQNDGFEGAAGLWQNEAARVRELYHSTVDRYSSPVLMESELKLCLGRMQSLIDWSREHVWDPKALPILEKHDKAIRLTLQKIIESIKNHQKPLESLAKAEELINEQLDEIKKKKQPAPSTLPRQESAPQELSP
jgi:hypothetical protein